MIDVSVFMLWLKRFVKWGAFVFVVILFVPIFPPLGFVGGVIGSLYYWKNPGRSGALQPVFRELFLDANNYREVPYYYRIPTANAYKQRPWCNPGDIQKMKPGSLPDCLAVYNDSSGHCNSWIIDFSCNGIHVPSSLWRDENLRKRIIHAALHPCSYLYDPETGVVNESQTHASGPTKFGTIQASFTDHVTAWREAACEKNRGLYFTDKLRFGIPIFRPEDDTRTVYISILDARQKKVIVKSLYKAVRNGDHIDGGYVNDYINN